MLVGGQRVFELERAVMAETALYFKYWGKAKPEGEEGSAYHLLPYHCLDVAAVAICWWQHSKSLRQQFALAMQTGNEELAFSWVMFFVALHDLGKLDIRFQCKSWKSAIKLQSDIPENVRNPDTEYFHGEAGYAWFLQEAYSYGFADVELGLEWMAEVAGHHGVIPNAGQKQSRFSGVSPLLIERDKNARLEWVKDLSRLFQVELTEIPQIVPPMLAGFCSVCDWIGSSDYFSYEDEEGIDLAGYLNSRVMTAKEALNTFGLLAQLEDNQKLEDLFPGYKPYGLQTLINVLPVRQNLTLIEAPTGSGKTETAIVYAAKQLHAGLADSIIFALPSQATANAMLDRLQAVAERLFEEGANVVLAHGKSGLQSALKSMERVTEQGAEEAGYQAIRWLTASKKRAFLGQIGVCTIDQVLLSVLPVRHKFVRGFGIQKSLLIVDEVHAYDCYMYGLLGKVLENQYRAGGSVLLLSATLPQSQRQYLANHWNGVEIEETSVYPLITQVYATQRSQIFPITDSKQLPEQKLVEIETWALPELQFDDASLRRIVDAARQGAKVVVICNLVADAQSVAECLADPELNMDIPVDLFHSRFRFVDRQCIENEIKSLYGKDSKKRASGGRILVATQVVEQSLDLDFDWMVTQLCPVDLLFQRMGRLHRHTRSEHERPAAYRTARCVVILPAQALQYGQTGKYVYQNIRLLWRTEQLLAKDAKIEFPKAYRDWIGKVYDENPWLDESQTLTAAYDDFRDKVEEVARMAANYVTNLDVASYFSDESDKASVLTRDGEVSLTLLPCVEKGKSRLTLEGELLDKQSEHYWEQVSLNSVSVPSSWSDMLSDCSKEDGIYFLSMEQQNEVWFAMLNGKHRITYHKTLGLKLEK